MLLLDDFKVNQEDHKSSRKVYRMICSSCGKDRGYQRKSRYGRGLCRNCVSSTIHKNKKVSLKTRKKMSDNSWSKKGMKHPLKGKKHKKSTIQKLSKIAAKQCCSYERKHIYNGTNGQLLMRSSWEVKYAEWLDKNKIKWEYEPTFTLSNGLTYIADFRLLDGTIIEIKGYFRPDAINKWQKFCSDYPNIPKQLLMKKELGELGVL